MEYYVDLACLVVEAKNEREAEEKALRGIKDGTYEIEICNIEPTHL